LENLIKTRNSL